MNSQSMLTGAERKARLDSLFKDTKCSPRLVIGTSRPQVKDLEPPAQLPASEEMAQV